MTKNGVSKLVISILSPIFSSLFSSPSPLSFLSSPCLFVAKLILESLELRIGLRGLRRQSDCLCVFCARFAQVCVELLCLFLGLREYFVQAGKRTRVSRVERVEAAKAAIARSIDGRRRKEDKAKGCKEKEGEGERVNNTCHAPLQNWMRQSEQQPWLVRGPPSSCRRPICGSLIRPSFCLSTKKSS